MNSPSLSVGIWWTIAAAAGALHLATMRRWMPTPCTQLQVSMAPLLAAVIVPAVSLGRHKPLSEGLGMASGLLLGIPLSLVGRHRELSRRILEWEANGRRRGELLAPTCVIARYVIIVPPLAVFGWWLA
ncbi:hypothetical protein [Actinacidiphila acididurans]|uniref:Uncharacterized protein n=1 Tax=Actinacidiphila acididurans TaxID=2784346 RepID=A0ABS2TZZ9_9ACTN|nr:hypothetical protein [Actinacidiphila acididurans]MBM9508531.1 hypothetical protein [Actinacidiphila acididurans]